MAEPTTTAAAFGISSAFGLTIFGVATGLHPGILIGGLAGGLWAASYQPPVSVVSRLIFLAVSSMIAGYLAPVIAAVAAAAAVKLIPFWPADVTRDALQYPVAFCVGFLGLHWIGPALMRRAEKYEGEH